MCLLQRPQNTSGVGRCSLFTLGSSVSIVAFCSIGSSLYTLDIRPPCPTPIHQPVIVSKHDLIKRTSRTCRPIRVTTPIAAWPVRPPRPGPDTPAPSIVVLPLRPTLAHCLLLQTLPVLFPVPGMLCPASATWKSPRRLSQPFLNTLVYGTRSTGPLFFVIRGVKPHSTESAWRKYTAQEHC